MRQPLDWIAVTLCLCLLLANQVRTRQTAGIQATPPPLGVQISSPRVETTNPFAWIQEDGSEVYLPAPDSAGRSREDGATETEPSSTTHALYTWSSPVNGAESERAWYP